MASNSGRREMLITVRQVGLYRCLRCMSGLTYLTRGGGVGAVWKATFHGGGGGGGMQIIKAVGGYHVHVHEPCMQALLT